MTTLAFDIYGTLINTSAVVGHLNRLIGEPAEEFSNQWRSKQLEYTWRYGLMDQYRDFRECTRQSLDWTCVRLGCEISESDKMFLMGAYLELPPFQDVEEGLQRLKAAGFSMLAFSNGVPSDLQVLIRNAGLEHLLDGIISVDDKKTFKPDPVLYRHVAQVGGSKLSDTWLVSSNSFDVCGAVSAGMKAFWLQRTSANIFDPWEFKPTHIVSSLDDIVRYLTEKILNQPSMFTQTN